MKQGNKIYYSMSNINELKLRWNEMKIQEKLILDQLDLPWHIPNNDNYLNKPEQNQHFV